MKQINSAQNTLCYFYIFQDEVKAFEIVICCIKLFWNEIKSF